MYSGERRFRGNGPYKDGLIGIAGRGRYRRGGTHREVIRRYTYVYMHNARDDESGRVELSVIRLHVWRRGATGDR